MISQFNRLFFYISYILCLMLTYPISYFLLHVEKGSMVLKGAEGVII